MKIPQHGLSREAVLEKLEAFRAGDMPWRDGRTWAYVYDPRREAEEVIKQAYMMYLSENALDPTVFPSVLRLAVVLYRSKELRKYQIYACSNWTGYTVINATVQSTKSGGPLAAAWAVLHFIGDNGYLEIARQVLDATRRIAEGIERIDGLRLLARPEMNLVAFTSDTVSVFHVIDEMKQRGWYVQPQLGFQDSKENIHLSINPASVKWVDALLADLRVSVEKAKTSKSGDLAATIRDAFGSIDPATLNDETLGQMLGMAGVQGAALPARMAEINEVLNALPAALRERLLTEFLNSLMQYREETHRSAK